MFEVVSRVPAPLIKWVAASGGVKKGQLCKSASGAAPVAVEHSGQTILGVALEDADAGAIAYLKPVAGAILKIPYLGTATNQTLAVADIGTDFDIDVSITGDMTLDTDDDSGSFILMRFDNVRKEAYVTIPNDLILHG